MSLVYVQDTELTTVGETIRKFTGTDTKYTPSEMCAGIKDAIANYAVKKTVTGTSIAVNDAAKFRPVEMKLYGKSTQATTKGNQLLNLPDRKNYVSNGITLNLIDGVVTVSGQNTKGSENNLTLWGGYSATNIILTLDAGTYTLSDCNIGTRASGSLVTYSGTFTLSETTGFTWIYTRAYKKDEVVNETTYPMVNKGSTALAWEPYTGGIASPNIDYEQEVVPSGVSGSIEYKILGGNIIDWYSSLYSERNGLKSEILADGGIKITGTNTSNYTNMFYTTVKLPKGIYHISGGDQSSDLYPQAKWKGADGKDKYGIGKSFTLETETDVIISIQTDGTRRERNMVVYPMLNVGAEKLPFEKPTKQPLTLQTPNGLHGIPLGATIPSVIANSHIHMRGVYFDNVLNQYVIADTKNDNGGNVQRIYEYGVEDFPEVLASGDSKWYDSEKSYSYEMKNMKTHSPLGNLGTGIMEKSTHFTGYSFNQFYNKAVENGCLTGQSYIVVNISKSLGICKTVDEFRQYCIDNNVKFYKVLKTPIETDLTPEEIEQYKALHMNCPNTTILNDANTEMELTYVVEPK